MFRQLTYSVFLALSVFVFASTTAAAYDDYDVAEIEFEYPTYNLTGLSSNASDYSKDVHNLTALSMNVTDLLLEYPLNQTVEDDYTVIICDDDDQYNVTTTVAKPVVPKVTKPADDDLDLNADKLKNKVNNDDDEIRNSAASTAMSLGLLFFVATTQGMALFT